MKCKIKWVGENGKNTADENEATHMVRMVQHVQWIEGREILVNASDWFPCCKKHMEMSEEMGLEKDHHWESMPINRESVV